MQKAQAAGSPYKVGRKGVFRIAVGRGTQSTGNNNNNPTTAMRVTLSEYKDCIRWGGRFQKDGNDKAYIVSVFKELSILMNKKNNVD